MLRIINYSHLVKTILLILLAIIIDQCTKIFISKIMLENRFTTISVFSFLELVFVRNTGISFGLFSEGGSFNRYFFSTVSLSIGTMLIFISFFINKKILRNAFIFISAGAIGNGLDRVYFGGVIDFIDFFIYNFHWPAFNLADIFITIGVFFLILDSFVENK